jgi:hypothetical protein
MVVLCRTNLKIDTLKLVELLPINQTFIKIEKRGVLQRGSSSRDKIRRRAKPVEVSKTTGFGHNSITLVMLNNGAGTMPQKEITIKIFQNGVFHMTGVLADAYDKDSLSILLNTMWNECKESILDAPAIWEILDRRVVLMNYTTELNPITTVARESLYTTICGLHRSDIVTSYDPDVYPGIKIQFVPTKWTAKVFRTGKIILTGITTHDDCLALVKQLGSLLEITLPNKQVCVGSTSVS